MVCRKLKSGNCAILNSSCPKEYVMKMGIAICPILSGKEKPSSKSSKAKKSSAKKSAKSSKKKHKAKKKRR